MECRICNNRGWVETRFHGPSICPLCKAETEEKKGYDQDAIWMKLLSLSNGSLEECLCENISKVDATNIVAHFAFDKNVTPQGNLYTNILNVSSVSKPRKLTKDQLVARGYVVLEDGSVQTVNDIPVGSIYNHLLNWAGPEKYSIWEMKEQVEIDPNRKGNPLFMDDNMVAIRVRFKETVSKDYTVKNAFLALRHALSSNDIGEITNWVFV